MPATSSYNPTGNAAVDGVLSGTRWAVSTLTYSFPTSASFYGSYPTGEAASAFQPLNGAQQDAVRDVLGQYAAVANIAFVEVTETATQHGDLRYAESGMPSTAWAYYPSTSAVGGDVWLSSGGDYDAPREGNYAFTTFLHETGHALGLKHPHEVSGKFGATPTATDSMENSVMSYRSYVNASTSAGYVNETWGYAQTLMMLDIAAIQQMYGANFNTNGGATTYSWSATTGEMFVNGVGQGAAGGNRIFETVWDGNGVDTYDFSNYTTALTVDLQPGAWSTVSTTQLAKLHYNGSQVADGNIANALLYNGDLRSLIENAKGGTGADRLTGNVAANLLDGGGGNDTLVGGGGSDKLYGGAGTDTAVFSGTRAQYAIVLLSDGSLQISDIRSGAPDGVDVASGVESFAFADRTYSASELSASSTPTTPPPSVDQPPAGLVRNGTSKSETLTGAAAGDTLNGLAGNDTLVALAGNDRLDGGADSDTLNGGVGADVLIGGSGIDAATYADATAAVTADLATPAGNSGEALGDTYSGVENLKGSAHADTLRGDGGANVLSGGAGNDLLLGRAGADTLNSDDGDDTLNGGTGADKLYGGAGLDTASYAGATAGVTADLGASKNNRGDASGDTFNAIENLQGSDFNDILRGTSGVNVLDGGSGNDMLTGGAGSDRLVGGEGSDTAIYSGKASSYVWTLQSDGTYTVQDLRSGAPDGTDKLAGVEILKFSDKSITLPVSAMAGNAESAEMLEDQIPYAVLPDESRSGGRGRLDSLDFDFARFGGDRGWQDAFDRLLHSSHGGEPDGVDLSGLLSHLQGSHGWSADLLL